VAILLSGLLACLTYFVIIRPAEVSR
jgi:hypothetical protein